MAQINSIRGIIPFPCHAKEKILVYENAEGCCSVKCPSCDKFALFDFNSMQSKPVGAAKGIIHQLTKQNKHID